MTRDSVLTILMKQGDYISGEKISSSLGISRAAVNAAVMQLRAEGYEIASSTNKGYMLKTPADKITAGELCVYLPEGRTGNIECFETVDSTNKRLRELASDGAPDGQVVLACGQTAGRGRLGRTFVSPQNKGIYLSMLLKPSCLPGDAVAITAWTAVAISNAIENVCGVRPGIKWVNDLVLNRKKICGILTEMSVESENGHIQYIIIGIGVNVSETQDDFPDGLNGTASSLLIETGKSCLRAKLAAEMIAQLDIMRSSWPDGSDRYLSLYRSGSVTLGREIRVISSSGSRAAEAIAVNDDFSLRVRYDDGSEGVVSSGEVSVRGLYGYV